MRSPEIVQVINFEGKNKQEDVESQAVKLEFKTFKPKVLIPIIESFYGKKDWYINNDNYWKAQLWNFQEVSDADKEKWPTETKKYYQYLQTIIKWTLDEETRGHLDPVPGIPIVNEDHEIIAHNPPDTKNKDELDMAVADLAKYYFNKGEPHKIRPLMAFAKDTKEEELLAVLTLRWRGDMYIPKGKQKIASIERLIVNPDKRKQGIGYVFVSQAINYAFFKHKGYKGDGADEIRAWVMTDRVASNYQINLNLFINKLGFKVLNSPYASWKDYARIIGEKTDRNALWLSLKKEDWKK